ncbi:MAG: hypothetical protein BWY65_02334 [Firmicutes bacterium ADurb.Bin373]|nr:MAG: hypothetical protein BWY65_02334 [Firmicutes bacterium ADurb.Bin373]
MYHTENVKPQNILNMRRYTTDSIFPYAIALWLCPVFIFLIFPRVSSGLSPIQKMILFNGVFLLLLGVGVIPYIAKRITAAEFVIWELVPFLVSSAIFAAIGKGLGHGP